MAKRISHGDRNNILHRVCDLMMRTQCETLRQKFTVEDVNKRSRNFPYKTKNKEEEAEKK